MVSGVKYILFWNGGSVKKVLARIILTDVQLDTKPITIKQMFEAKWNYLPSANDQFNLLSVDTMTKYENVITSEAYLKSLRSGIKGELHIKRFNFNLAYLVNKFFKAIKKESRSYLATRATQLAP